MGCKVSDFEFRIDESPFSASTTDNWVARLGGLPPYIRGVTRGLMKNGHDFREALQIAIGVMGRWAAGGETWGHKSHATPATRAKAAAALAQWEAMKAAAHSKRSDEDMSWLDFVPITDEELAAAIEPRDEAPFLPPPPRIELSVRDGGFLGETTGNGAEELLPVGPTKKQADAINKAKIEDVHHFVGQDRQKCTACGKPAANPIHAVPSERDPGDNVVTNAAAGAELRFLWVKHPFRLSYIEGDDTTLCIDCGQDEEAQIHGYLEAMLADPDPAQEVIPEWSVGNNGPEGGDSMSRAVAQPIPPIPRQVGVIKPASSRRTSHNANVKNYETGEGPLRQALSSHYKEQGTSTVNRMLGKRGKQMLKRASIQVITPSVIDAALRDLEAELDARAATTGTTTTRPATTTGAPIAPTSAATTPPIGLIASGITAATLASGSVTAAALAQVLKLSVEGVAIALGFGSVVVLGAALAAGTITLEMLKVAFPEKVQVNDANVETELEGTNATEAPNVNPAAIYDQTFWQEKTRGLLEPHLNVLAQLAQHEVARQVDMPKGTDDSVALGAVRSAMAQLAAETAARTTEATSRHLADTLQEGIANGESKDEIGARVSTLFHKHAEDHAKLVAATTSHSAYNEAAAVYAAHLPAGIVGGRAWIAHHDEKTRDTHRIADGQERPSGQHFQVGGVPMRFPGDTTAPPHEWINCRCSQAWLKPGESFGTLADAAEQYVKAFLPPPKAESKVKVEASSLTA